MVWSSFGDACIARNRAISVAVICLFGALFNLKSWPRKPINSHFSRIRGTGISCAKSVLDGRDDAMLLLCSSRASSQTSYTAHHWPASMRCSVLTWSHVCWTSRRCSGPVAPVFGACPRTFPSPVDQKCRSTQGKSAAVGGCSGFRTFGETCVRAHFR